jgi:FAD/FMN-containing dehydrogenase
MTDVSRLVISGDKLNDSEILKKYSKDASSYTIRPALVVAPRNEEDILNTLRFAREEGLSLTCRAGGSGLSGAGIGSGIILNFKKYFNQVISVGEETIVQPGTVLDHFLAQMKAYNLMLPSVPSSSYSCALGGNVATRSTGPRTARYGTIDPFITSMKFVTAAGEVVDTRHRLPDYLGNALADIRNRYLADSESMDIVKSRPFIAGGYNLKALEMYDDVRDIAAHLMVSSVGTLAIISEIRLKLMENKKSQGTFVAHFRDFDEFAEAANRIKALDPSALEFSDASCSKHVNGKILNYSDPSIVGTLIVEFDESREQAQTGRAIIEEYDISRIWEIASGSDDEEMMWNDRKRILPSLWRYARDRKWVVPSIIDDIAIHLKDFAAVHRDMVDLMNDLNLEISFFGHLGFGSVHARPYFDPARGQMNDQVVAVSQKTFEVLRKYNGTLVGEHNAGRSRSVYLEQELGSAYQYTVQIKELFDPDDILNPGTVFNTPPIYENMDFTV